MASVGTVIEGSVNSRAQLKRAVQEYVGAYVSDGVTEAEKSKFRDAILEAKRNKKMLLTELHDLNLMLQKAEGLIDENIVD